MARRETNGATVKALREALGIRQGEFARDVLVSAGYLSNIEAGRKQPDPAVTRRIAERLGTSVDAITYPVPDEVLSSFQSSGPESPRSTTVVGPADEQVNDGKRPTLAERQPA